MLLLLIACSTPDPVREPPPPRDLAWPDAPAIELSPARYWGSTELARAARPTRVRHEPRTALSFVVDAEAGRVHVLDEQFQHDGNYRCLDPLEWYDETFSEWQGRCEEDFVEVHRGYIDSEFVVDVALDSDNLEAWVVNARGEAKRVELDVTLDPSFGWLRADDDPIDLGVPDVSSAVVSDGELWVASAVGVHSAGGETRDFDSPELLSGEGGLWVLDDEGLWAPGASAAEPAEIAAVAGDHAVWWSEGALHWTDGASVEADQPEALVLDRRSMVAWMLVDRVVQRATPEGVEVQDQQAGVLGITDTHDILAIDLQIAHILYDEASLADERPPLQLTHVAFLERPRDTGERILCGGEPGGENFETYIPRSMKNCELMETMPGDFALGITPRYGEGINKCDLSWEFTPFTWERNWENGVLFHQPIDACEDFDCYDDALTAGFGHLLALEVRPTWVSGFEDHTDAGWDWVDRVLEDGQTKLLFFGAGIDPNIERDDPRWKNPWPLRPGDGTATFEASTIDALPNGDGSGLSFYPGNTRSGFGLATCPGLLTMECQNLAAGDDVFDEEDIQAMGLLLRHAIARRSATEVSTWNWHLPDLNGWDYVEDCEITEDGLWTGECQGKLLVDMAWDWWQVLVQNGVAEFRPPSELGE